MVLTGEVNCSNSMAQSGHQSGQMVRKTQNPVRMTMSTIRGKFLKKLCRYGAPLEKVMIRMMYWNWEMLKMVKFS